MGKELFEVHTMEEALDTFIGKVGTPNRDKFDAELFAARVGDIIRFHRLEKKMTHEQLGKLIGVSARKMICLENGKGLTLKTLANVVQVFNGKLNVSIKFNCTESRVELGQVEQTH